MGFDRQRVFFNRLPSAALRQVSFPICPLADYNADATTKQNILCDGRAARRVIQEATSTSLKSDNGTSVDGLTQPGKNGDGGEDLMAEQPPHPPPPPRFEYLLPSRPQLFVLVLDRSSLLAAAVEGAPGKEGRKRETSKSCLSGTIKKIDRMAFLGKGKLTSRCNAIRSVYGFVHPTNFTLDQH